MNTNFSHLSESLTTDLMHGEEGVFCLARRDGDGDLILITRRRAFPVLFAQIDLATESQHLQLTETDWEGELIVDDNGTAPTKARVSFTGPGLIVDSSTDTFTGTLTVLAVPQADQRRLLALDATFFHIGDVPQSSVLWDTSPEIVHHWHTELLRRRGNGLLS